DHEARVRHVLVRLVLRDLHVAAVLVPHPDAAYLAVLDVRGRAELPSVLELLLALPADLVAEHLLARPVRSLLRLLLGLVGLHLLLVLVLTLRLGDGGHAAGENCAGRQRGRQEAEWSRHGSAFLPPR